MAALINLSDLVNRLTGGNSGTPELPWVYVAPRIGAAAAPTTLTGRMTSLWQWNSIGRTRASTPTTVVAPTNATAGAMPFNNPGGGRQKWLLGLAATSSQLGSLIIYDRLLQIGGLSGTNTGVQSVGGALTRSTAGAGNEIWIEINTQIGASSTTITVSYTDQDNNLGATSKATPIGNTGLREAGRILPVTLADDDTGARAVANCTLAATTGTAGDFGVVVARRLATIPLQGTGVPAILDLITRLPGVRELESNSCLALAWQASGTTSPEIDLTYSMVEA